MFSARENSLLAHPAVEDACFVDDVLRVVSPTATTESVVLFREMIEVEDGGKVKINPQEVEELSGEGSKACDLFGCGFFRKSGRIWWRCAKFPGAPNSSAFLVDGDEGDVARECRERVGEIANLNWRDEIAGEENISRRSDLGEERYFLLSELGSLQSNNKAGGVHEFSRAALTKLEKMG